MGTQPLGLKLKVGRFRPPFGKINILHTHDLPQSCRPLPIQEFLGEEGFIQNGVSGNFFIPTPWDKSSSMDLTLQVLNGGGISLSPPLRSRAPPLPRPPPVPAGRGTHNLALGWSRYHHPPGH